MRFSPSSPEDLPLWVRELPGIDEVTSQWVDSAQGADAAWKVSVSLPPEVAKAAESGELDAALLLAGLRYAAARIDEKTAQLVAICRSQGRSWTQIGQLLGMTKQSAWERYSGEKAASP